MRTLVHHLIEQQAAERGDAPALSFKNTTLTYAELWTSLEAVARGLLTLGVRRSDRVGVYLDKRVETVSAIFGTSCAGGVFVPINPVLRARQVGHILNDCDVRILITTVDRLATLDAELAAAPSVTHVVLVDGSAPTERVATAGSFQLRTWEEAFGSSSIDADATRIEPRSAGIDVDMAAILYTSGSTGQPEGGRALPPQPHRGRGEREHVPAQRRVGRDPRGAADQFRCRLQPVDDRLQRRRPRRARELPAPCRRHPGAAPSTA